MKKRVIAYAKKHRKMNIRQETFVIYVYLNLESMDTRVRF